MEVLVVASACARRLESGVVPQRGGPGRAFGQSATSTSKHAPNRVMGGLCGLTAAVQTPICGDRLGARWQ